MSAATAWAQALAFLLTAPAADTSAQYDRAAGAYAAFRWLWIQLAGAPAEREMLAELRRTLRPGDRVLDAGCGTGAMARAIHGLEPEVEITMLDRSPAMLAATADVPGRRELGSVLELPFPDRSFDLIVAAWVLETIPDRERALEALMRALAPGGTLLLTFCSRPTGRLVRALSAPLRHAVRRWFAGTFGSVDAQPSGCSPTNLVSFRRGLVSAASYRR